MDSEYISVLKTKLTSLNVEKNEKHNEIKQLLSEIEVIQNSVNNIVELLNAEGISIENINLEGLVQESIADSAYYFLKQKNEKTPIHYQDIYTGILSLGKFVPGKNPAANLLTHISRDKRFVRPTSGTYGLSEWGIQVPPKKRRKNSKSKSSIERRGSNE